MVSEVSEARAVRVDPEGKGKNKLGHSTALTRLKKNSAATLSTAEMMAIRIAIITPLRRN